MDQALPSGQQQHEPSSVAAATAEAVTHDGRIPSQEAQPTQSPCLAAPTIETTPSSPIPVLAPPPTLTSAVPMPNNIAATQPGTQEHTLEDDDDEEE